MSAITCGLLDRMRGTHCRTRSSREAGVFAARSLVEPITRDPPAPSCAGSVLSAVISRPPHGGTFPAGLSCPGAILGPPSSGGPSSAPVSSAAPRAGRNPVDTADAAPQSRHMTLRIQCLCIDTADPAGLAALCHAALAYP